MDYIYSADINPAETIMNLRCTCANRPCEYDDYQDVTASIGHNITTWKFICPTCGARNEAEADNDFLFDR